MNLLKLFKDIVSDCLDRKISRIVHFMKLFSFVEIKYIVLHCVDPSASGFHLSNLSIGLQAGLMSNCTCMSCHILQKMQLWCAILGLQCELGLLHALRTPDGFYVAIFDALLGMNVLCLGHSSVSVVQLKHGPLSLA